MSDVMLNCNIVYGPLNAKVVYITVIESIR